MKWSEFYEKYWDWSDTTRRSRISSLEDVGPGAEVVEVIYEILDWKVRAQLIRKAMKLGACFTADDLVEVEYEIPEDLFAQLASYAGLDKDNPHLDENNMSWKDFYDDYYEWNDDVLARRVNLLTNFGPAKEIIDAFDHIAFDHENLAVQLIEKAIAAGVKFSGEQISDLVLICDDNLLEQAIRVSADTFKTKDLDDLYTYCGDDILLDVAIKYKIKLPECLANHLIKELGCRTFGQLISDFDYILECLRLARKHLDEAHTYALWDISRQRREWSALKYSQVEDAQHYITLAINTWNYLEFPDKGESSFPRTFPCISIGDMWSDFWINNFWMELIASSRIKQLQQTVEQGIHAISKLRDEYKNR